MRFCMVIRHVHTEHETSKMSQSPWIVLFEPILKPPQPLIWYLILRLELALLYNYFWRLWKLLVFYPKPLFFLWADAKHFPQGCPIFSHHQTSLWMILWRNPFSWETAQILWKSMLLFFKGWFVTFQRPCHWNHAWGMQGSSGCQSHSIPVYGNLQHWDSGNESTRNPGLWQHWGFSFSGSEQPPYSVHWPL